MQPLSDFPLMGQEEPLLRQRKGNYRYLVEGNYKIIYRVVRQTVIIVTVFDTRRNPESLQVQ
ncbi:MAG: type II toxin-antitoxin system RelE/ParE family toxin [Ignavibacteriae bacterium]|nr:type II toxin-antitoxin system RelE/ParE family toxin [Ignavibacteriota bacterium]